MKKISDLLDDYSEMELDIKTETPLSSERIRELTMSKIESKKNKPRRIGFRVLVAAAVIAMMALTVFAVGSGADWFRAFFAEKKDAELSAGQVEYIDENTMEPKQSQTVNGYTVTLESYISDGAKAYMKFKIQAPEGKELPKVIFWTMKPYKNGELVWGGVSSRWGRLDSGEVKGTGLYLLTMEGIPMDGDGLVLSLIDICEYDGEGRLIAEGSWDFELEAPDTRAIELIDEPVAGVLCKTPNGDEFEVTVTSACLRAMSLKIVYEETDVQIYADHDFDAVNVIMKDGSSVTLNWSGGRKYTDDEGVHLSADFEVAAPLELDEVAYIKLPGDIQIPVNE